MCTFALDFNRCAMWRTTKPKSIMVGSINS